MKSLRKRIIAQYEISELLHRWAEVIDCGRWNEYEGLYAPGAVLDFSAIGSPGGTPAEHRDYLENTSWPTNAGQQHPIANIRVTLRGRRFATARSYCLSPVRKRDGRFLLVAVEYEDELRRVRGEWRIASRTCRPMVMEPADFAQAKHLTEV